jgi:1-acyl-sn-glycerol-3-phosphate acyltransferase
MQYLRSKLFDAFAILWTILLSPSLPILLLLGSSSRYIRIVSQFWVSGLLFGLKYIVGLVYIERGRHNIPGEPFIIIANHQSTFETIILSHLFPNAAFIAKQEVARIPAVGWYLKNYPMIMIDRGGGSRTIHKMIEQSRATLADGRSIIVFPEGTRKSVSAQISFKRGVEILYSELQQPVLPIALNSGVYWPPKQSSRRSGPVIISYLEPILPGLSRDAFRRKAEAALQEEKERLVKEALEDASTQVED